MFIEFTGERFIPEYIDASLAFEHYARYKFTEQFIAGKKVLDIACGEGYGSNLMSRCAAHVTGVDISADTIKCAAEKYQSSNLSFLEGSMESIPIQEDNYFDVIVSFETYEHVAAEQQELFLKEVKRLLKPDGLLLISTPNNEKYRIAETQNEFHKHEVSFNEFKTKLEGIFNKVNYFCQKAAFCSAISALGKHKSDFSGNWMEITKHGFNPMERTNFQAEDNFLYTIAVCSMNNIKEIKDYALLDASNAMRFPAVCGQLICNNKALTCFQTMKAFSGNLIFDFICDAMVQEFKFKLYPEAALVDEISVDGIADAKIDLDNELGAYNIILPAPVAECKIKVTVRVNTSADQIDSLSNINKVLQERNDNLETETANLNLRLESLENKNTGLDEENILIKNQLEIAEQKTCNLEAELKQNHNLYNELAEKYTALQTKYNSPQTAQQENAVNIENKEYSERVKSEIKSFKNQVDIHALPEIFHYWSNKYLLPAFLEMGFSSIDDFFATNMQKSCNNTHSGCPAFASIGAGNCDTEIRIAKILIERGLEDFTIECLEINPHCLDRGRELAKAENVAEKMIFSECDFNNWQPNKKYSAIIANQALHHVVKLEELFATVKASLEKNGSFIVSDMIGRNGHQRWPEALIEVHRYWHELPESYRYNHVLRRHEELYENWDCASDSFEGIRAQDILPNLIQYFNFELFYAFSNIIDIFIDRAFGHNFNPDIENDRSFIDKVHARDEVLILSGIIKPTHMIGVMKNEQIEDALIYKNLTPEFCIRKPDSMDKGKCND